VEPKDRVIERDRARLDVRSETELPWVQRQVLDFPAARGLDQALRWSLAIAASEAATNMLKFPGVGILTLRFIDGSPSWLELEARDRGPGIDDAEAAVENGVSEGHSLAVDPRPLLRRGLGLGAIRRLTGMLQIRQNPGGGTVLLARKGLRSSDSTRSRRLTPVASSAEDLLHHGHASSAASPWVALDRSHK
jgi:serine/threonine-protein kinase RsbT